MPQAAHPGRCPVDARRVVNQIPTNGSRGRRSPRWVDAGCGCELSDVRLLLQWRLRGFGGWERCCITKRAGSCQRAGRAAVDVWRRWRERVQPFGDVNQRWSNVRRKRGTAAAGASAASSRWGQWRGRARPTRVGFRCVACAAVLRGTISPEPDNLPSAVPPRGLHPASPPQRLGSRWSLCGRRVVEGWARVMPSVDGRQTIVWTRPTCSVLFCAVLSLAAGPPAQTRFPPRLSHHSTANHEPALSLTHSLSACLRCHPLALPNPSTPSLHSLPPVHPRRAPHTAIPLDSVPRHRVLA